MKRYDGGPRWPDENGEWVLHSEAEAEIEKALRDGYDRGRIVQLLRQQGLQLAANVIVLDSLPPLEPKPHDDHWKHVQEPRPLDRIEVGVYTEAYVINAINALVDAVNDLRSRQYTQSDIDNISRREG